MSLQRMIVIPPDTFERFKKLVVEDKKLSDLDREMKKVLYNNKINNTSKWHFYRQNLIKYLNAKGKLHNNIKDFTKTHNTKISNYKHKTVQTLTPSQKSSGSKVKLKKSVEEIPSLEQLFSGSNRFSSLDDIDTTGENDLIDLDVDDIVRSKALEGQPLSTKITNERKSLDPSEYRVFELNNGEIVNVPVERQIVTRAALKRARLHDTAQSMWSTVQQKKKKRKKDKSLNTSTPKKKHQDSNIKWIQL